MLRRRRWAGAVNIVTRPFTDRLSGAGCAWPGDSNLRLATLDASLSDEDSQLGQFVAYISADKSDGYQAFRDQDYQPSAGDHKRTYQMYTEGVKYQADVTSQLRVQGSYQRTDGALAPCPGPTASRDDFETRSEDLATAKVDYQASDRLGLFIKGYWHNFDNLQRPWTLTSPAGRG